MIKMTYISSHKRKKRFNYEIFGLLYCLALIDIIIYYHLTKDISISAFKADLFSPDYHTVLKPFYFILIFCGLLLLIFGFGFVGMLRTRVAYLLYPASVLTCIFLSLSGFLYELHDRFHFFNACLISASVLFSVLILCFIIEKPYSSKYASLTMRIIDIVCGSLFIAYTIWKISGILRDFLLSYEGYFQLIMLSVSVVFVMSNAVYMYLKFETRYSVK